VVLHPFSAIAGMVANVIVTKTSGNNFFNISIFSLLSISSSCSSRLQNHKFSTAPGIWFIIGLFAQKELIQSVADFCPSDFWKVFGKELETGKDSKNGTSTNANRYTFDGFEVNPAERTCAQSGTPVVLTGKVFDLLVAFLENPNRLLGKDELMEQVWPDEFVEEGNLARNISTLRKALGDNGRTHRYISTVQGRGYRFLPEVSKRRVGSEDDAPGVPKPNAAAPPTASYEDVPQPSRRWILIIVGSAMLVTAAWLGSSRFLTPVTQIKTLAVLPLKSLDESDNYLGIGIADAVIRNVSQTHQLTVRPTSSVLHYVKDQTDALTAAKELNTDAVLDGTVQRSGDRLRVSINLLRTSDGASLWADNFDMPAADFFAIQDKVAQQVATRLQLHLESAQKVGPDNKYPANAVAYEFYLKGIFSLDQRESTDYSLSQMQETIDLFKKSIEADPNYALAHAQLAWAYVWTADFVDPSEKWADLARQEIKRADELDPNIAETHLAKAMLNWSLYGSYQNDDAIREILIAKQLNPNTSHGELAGIFGHLGLEDMASRELDRDLEMDPTSQSLKELTLILPFLRGDADGWLEARQKFPAGPLPHVDPWYYVHKGFLDDAKKALEERSTDKRPPLLASEALYLARKGEFK
jgi:DNA-binding winged helix-turn-helix (wHTH) protein/TolB-like protein